jgi:hypothetical protein
MKTRILTATTLTAAAALLLVGCSTGNNATPSAAPTSKSATPMQKPTPEGDKSPQAGKKPDAGKQSPTDKKTPAPNQKVTPPADIKTSDAVCTNGTATVSTNNEKITVPDCATVIVKASNSIIELGTTTNLTVEGSINSVTTKAAVQQVKVTGDANTITTGGSPKVTDSGKQNDTTAK